MTAAGSAPLLVDTHVHLDDPAFDDDRDAVLAAARKAGVRRFVNIGFSPERWQTSRLLGDAHPDIGLVFGVHPHLAHWYNDEVERRLSDLITARRPLAVGETGFDFARPAPDASDQRRAFRAQLSLAASRGLPVVIHQRNAAAALASELDRWPDLAPIVLHSFDGDRRFVDWAIERRCYVGIGGLACKPVSAPLRGLLREVPPDRLLLETDAPYLAPPGFGARRNTPASLPLIAARLAPLWDLSSERLCAITARNADAAFGLGLDAMQTG